MLPKKKEPETKKEEPKGKRRSLQQSILDIFPNLSEKGYKKVFKDTTHGCRDALIPILGWELFWYFYEKTEGRIHYQISGHYT